MKSRYVISLVLVVMMAVTAVPSSTADSIAETTSDSKDRCTGYYVGCDVSADGTTMIGQLNDYNCYSPSSLEYVKACGYPGSVFTCSDGFSYTFDTSTYSFVTLRSTDYSGPDYCGSVAVNSEGLTYVGCVSADCNEAVVAADPYVKGGFSERSAAYVIASCCGSAYSALLKFCEIIDTRGSAEGGIFMFADQKEAWYLECYTGHQYAAIRLPTDKMAVFGNEFSVHSLKEGTSSFTSKNLVDVAKSAHTDKYNADGSLDLNASYAVANDDYDHMRTWIGQYRFAENPDTTYDVNEEYPLLFTPKAGVTLKQVMDLTRDRFQGTPYCPDDNGGLVRTIGTETNAAANVVQIYKDLPKNLATVCWSCIGPSEFGVFIPVSVSVTDFVTEYKTLQSSFAHVDTSSMYGKIKALSSLCYGNRSILKEGVTGYWSALENYYISVYPKVIEKMKGMSAGDASSYVTEYTKSVEAGVVAEADRLYDQCMDHIARYTAAKLEKTVFPGYYEVSDFAQLYGWSSSTADSGIVLTHGDSKIVISTSLSSDRYTLTADISVNGSSEKVTAVEYDGSLCLPLSTMHYITSQSPVVIEPETHSGSGVDSALLFGIIAVVLVVALSGIAVYYRR